MDSKTDDRHDEQLIEIALQIGPRMIVAIRWHPRIPLGTKATFKNNIAKFDLAECPESPGIYIFARRFGKKLLVPIYIGKGANLRKRLRTQFNNFRLIEALANEKSGERVLMLGTISSRSPGAITKKLNIAERTHIEHALTAGHELLNVQLTKGRSDTVEVVGRKTQNHPFPRVMLARRHKHRD